MLDTRLFGYSPVRNIAHRSRTPLTGLFARAKLRWNSADAVADPPASLFVSERGNGCLHIINEFKELSRRDGGHEPSNLLAFCESCHQLIERQESGTE